MKAIIPVVIAACFCTTLQVSRAAASDTATCVVAYKDQQPSIDPKPQGTVIIVTSTGDVDGVMLDAGNETGLFWATVTFQDVVTGSNPQVRRYFVGNNNLNWPVGTKTQAYIKRNGIWVHVGDVAIEAVY